VSDLHVICPDCGGAIAHQCGANRGAIPDANATQIVAQIPGQAQIAQVSKSLKGPSPNKGKSYNQGYNAQFLEFWKVYPLRRDKRKAEKAWRNAVARLGANADARAAIIAGAIRYRDDPNRLDQFTKYAEGWLNADGWEDEPLPTRLNGKEPAHREITEADYEAAREQR